MGSITLNSGNVSAWADKSGSGRNATQSDGSRQIPYNTTGLNSKPALVFPNTTNGLFISTANYNWATDRKFANFVVAELTNTANVFLRLLNSEALNSGGTDYQFGFLGNGNPATNLFAIAGLDSITPQISNLFGAPRIITHIFGTGGMGANVNGSSINAGTILETPNCTGALATLGMVIGARVSPPSFSWRGPLGEVIQVSGDLTVQNRQRVEGYLAWKWRLQASLPADHPFRNAPPLI
jgi:hypothetical protein